MSPAAKLMWQVAAFACAVAIILLVLAFGSSAPQNSLNFKHPDAGRTPVRDRTER